MSVSTTTFKHVSYLWDEKKASAMAGDEVALLIYRSNLLGADLRLTNYGGGNTSCKTIEKRSFVGQRNGSDVGKGVWWRPWYVKEKRAGRVVRRSFARPGKRVQGYRTGRRNGSLVQPLHL